MKTKGHVLVNYTIKGKPGKMVIQTELKKINGMLVPRQNLWYGMATLNEDKYDLPESEYYVNAQYMADDIARVELNKLRAEHGRSLRIKK